jgi:hypothetical protein
MESLEAKIGPFTLASTGRLVAESAAARQLLAGYVDEACKVTLDVGTDQEIGLGETSKIAFCYHLLECLLQRIWEPDEKATAFTIPSGETLRLFKQGPQVAFDPSSTIGAPVGRCVDLLSLLSTTARVLASAARQAVDEGRLVNDGIAAIDAVMSIPIRRDDDARVTPGDFAVTLSDEAS